MWFSYNLQNDSVAVATLYESAKRKFKSAKVGENILALALFYSCESQ